MAFTRRIVLEVFGCDDATIIVDNEPQFSVGRGVTLAVLMLRV